LLLPIIRRRTNRLKDEGPSHFAAQNRFLPRRWRGRFAVPDPVRPPPGATPVLHQIEEAIMTLEQQIEELRVELSACVDKVERERIAAELSILTALLKRRIAAIDAQST